MSYKYRLHRWLCLLVASLALTALTSCTITPLDKKRAETVDASGNVVPVTTPQNIEIPEVDTRVAQQVRNNLIFGLNGGEKPKDPVYRLELLVSSTVVDATADTNTGDATSSRITVDANYTLREISNGEIVITGLRSSGASIDQRGQSFADQRAIRDAENRAAKEVAEQLRIAISAYLANQ